MIIIKNTKLTKLISLGFAQGITLWPFMFVKADASWITINHERIHGEQQKELLLILFYIWYLVEWVFKGYDDISFEREAYRKDTYRPYLSERKHYSFLKYMKNG